MKSSVLVFAAMIGTGAQAVAQALIGVHIDDGRLYSISVANGATAPLVTTDNDYYADVEFAPSGELYGLRIVNHSAGYRLELHQIDPVTGATTTVGPLNLPPPVGEGDLAFSPNGVLYGLQLGGIFNPTLFTIDLATGAGTVIGSVPPFHDFNGLTWRSDGMLLALDRQDNAMYVIDPNVPQIVGSFPIVPAVGGVGGMTSAAGTVFFNTAGPGGSIPGSNELWSFDPYTGAQALIGPLNVTGNGISGLAIEGCSTGLSYCTSGTSVHGCAASLSSVGTASVAATSGFSIVASNVEGQRQGLIFYGLSGAEALTWGVGSSSYLCVKPPTQRTNVQSSGGTIFQCDGSISIDWLAYVAATPGALGAPFQAGTTVWSQLWYRDPPTPKSTSLSNGLRFTTCP